MGHEASGIVHTIGSAVTNVQPGDRVALEPGFACRRCKFCKSGRYNLCPGMKFAASPPYDGTLTRLYKLPEDFVFKVPASLTLQEAVLLEPLSVAVHANRLANPVSGQRVLVLGAGTIGLLSAAVASAFGATEICLVDIDDRKLEFARGFIECRTFKPNLEATAMENSLALKESLADGQGINVVLECTGVESSVQTGVYALESGGVFVQVGMGKLVQAFPLMAVGEKELSIKGAFRYGPGDYDVGLSLLSSGKINVKPLISNILPFERASDAWEMTGRGEGIKNLIRVNPDI